MDTDSKSKPTRSGINMSVVCLVEQVLLHTNKKCAFSEGQQQLKWEMTVALE